MNPTLQTILAFVTVFVAIGQIAMAVSLIFVQRRLKDIDNLRALTKQQAKDLVSQEIVTTNARLDTRLEVIANRVGGIESRLDRGDREFSTLHGEDKKLLVQLLQNINVISERLARMEQDLDGLKGMKGVQRG